MDYLQLLEHSFEIEFEDERVLSRLEYLSVNIFDFTTYDSEADILFARKAIEVCNAISNRQTFEYQQDNENYLWYLIICNMPFFIDKLEWGTSIRGAWWGVSKWDEFEISSCGFYEGSEQILAPLKFNENQWNLFITAMSDFIKQGE